MFRQDFTCPALLKDQLVFTHTGLSPAMAGLSRPLCLSYEHHWPVPLSLATTDGISLMSVPPGTEMFQFPGFASPAYVFSWRYPSLGGLPHSDIHGSKPARGSPWLFAACHVLHRLLVPRHPPNALIILRSKAPRGLRRIRPPCTETIVRPMLFNTAHALAREERGVSPVPSFNRFQRISIIFGTEPGLLSIP